MKTTENAEFLFLPELGLSQFRVLAVGVDVENRTPTLNYLHFADRILWEALKNSSIRAQLVRMVRPFINHIELRPEGMSALMLAVFKSQNLNMVLNEGCAGYSRARIAQIVRCAERPPSEQRKALVVRSLGWK